MSAYSKSIAKSASQKGTIQSKSVDEEKRYKKSSADKKALQKPIPLGPPSINPQERSNERQTNRRIQRSHAVDMLQTNTLDLKTRQIEFWKSTEKYQRFDNSPLVPMAAAPLSKTTIHRKESIEYPYTIEPGNLISYNMGRGYSGRIMTARVISVAHSRKSIRTEDGRIVYGKFIPSGKPNHTTKDCLNTSRILKKLVQK
jgi:hypothetical protein